MALGIDDCDRRRDLVRRDPRSGDFGQYLRL